ncbi:MAG: Cys-tRNA(Pro) deacylase [Proteobacteria bacterium]|nr:MAG: Cys-tRNA(Pro) deacylase [Pseudomonadota bacterium]QKK11120.1 MAG: Cys-tRNA(Pro) deacylase [Pseudomonadota bacterium]
MTPAIDAAKRARISHKIHEYRHDPAAASYGIEAAQALGVVPERVFKTLLVSLNGDVKRLAVGIVPVVRQLDLKAIAVACGAKKAEMADTREAERATGYVVGGISPMGQKKCLPTLIDSSAQGMDTVYVSAGRRGLEIELAPEDLQRLTRARFAAIAR